MRPTFLGFKNPREVVQAPIYIPTVTSKGNSLKYTNVNKDRPKSSQSKRFTETVCKSTTEFVGPGKYTNDCKTLADDVMKKINARYTGEVIDSTIGAVTYAGDSKIIDLSFVSPRHRKSKDWQVATKSITLRDARSLRSSVLTIGTQEKGDTTLSQNSVRKDRSNSRSRILRDNTSPRVTSNERPTASSKILDRARICLFNQKFGGSKMTSLPVSLNGSFRERKNTPKRTEIKEIASKFEKSPEQVKKIPDILVESNKESKIIGDQLQSELMSLQLQLEELQRKALESKATYLEYEYKEEKESREEILGRDDRSILTPQINSSLPQTGNTTPVVEQYGIVDDFKPKANRGYSKSSKTLDYTNNSKKKVHSGKENIRYKY